MQKSFDIMPKTIYYEISFSEYARFSKATNLQYRCRISPNFSTTQSLKKLRSLPTFGAFSLPCQIAQNLAQNSHQKTAKDAYFTVFGRKQALERLSRARAFLTSVIIC